jgi:hypothetical protein
VADDNEIEVVDVDSRTVEKHPGDAQKPPDEQEELERFNQHVQQLVRNFVQQEVAGLDQRIRDLETLLEAPEGLAYSSVHEQRPDNPARFPDGDIPPFIPEERQDGLDGVEWYTPANNNL